MKSKTITILLILSIFITNCGNKKTISNKDIFFGLSIGMNAAEADSILKQMIDNKELDNFGAHLTQKRENQDGEILINLIKPTLENDQIQSLTCWVQVSTNQKEFSEKFHKTILDQLKETYGNADKVKFEGDQSILNWDLKGLFKIELTIDPKNEEGIEMYSIKYFK